MAHTPTPEQQTIIDFIRANPSTNLMVDARAGAAKTSTIEMAAEFIPPTQAPLAVAFNKRIADELAERLPSYFQCRTLNALGHQAWQQARGAGKRLIVDADKMYALVKDIVPAGSSEVEDQFATVLNLSRRAKSIGLVPQGAPMGVKGLIEDNFHTWEDIAFDLGLFDISSDDVFFVRQVLNKSIQQAFNSIIDYDDQIYMSTLFGGIYPKYPTVIVDESQDLSALNHIQLKKLVGKRLIAVGDPHQAIYAFRGADAQSMSSLAYLMGEDGFSSSDETKRDKIGEGKFARLGLTKSFRVPHKISARQLKHVPDFGSMPFLAQGHIEHWPMKKVPGPVPLDGVEPATQDERNQSWSILDIPDKGFVLCRNNAPLMRLAFAFIKKRRRVTVMGRDIGASMANLLLKITGKTSSKSISDCYTPINAWKTRELEKCAESESKQDRIFDQYDSLMVLLEAHDEEPDSPRNLKSLRSNQTCAEFIRTLFSDKANMEGPTLSSGHRAKGLEREWVMHLDPWRIPSKIAIKAQRRGDPRPMVQELNLGYVIETRSKHTLVLANLSDCIEAGEER